MATVKKIDNGHWMFPEQLDFKKAQGFIYVIRRVSTGQIYIGKKNFRSGAKKDFGRQSNWRSYTSSSKDVNTLIETFGKEDFRFFVVEQYYTKGGLGWAETWSQCYAEVASNHVKYLNRLIEKVSWKSTEKVTDRHKDRLTKLMNL
jgi:hypothetical protein